MRIVGRYTLAAAALAKNRLGAANELLFPRVELRWADALGAAQLRDLHAHQHDPHLLGGRPFTTLL